MDELDLGGSRIDVAQTRDVDGTPIIAIVGELDLSNAERVRDSLRSTFSASPQRIIFDLAGLEFMDSSGIAVLLGAKEQCEIVELRHTPSLIRRIIEITGLTDTLQIVS